MPVYIEMIAITSTIFSKALENTASWNWEAIEAVGTWFLGLITFVTLVTTICQNKKIHSLEK